MRRRLLLIPAAVLLAAVVVLVVEVWLARTGGRLDDQTGARPTRLEVRPGPDPVHVVWLGDSTTTGVGADDFVDSMAHRVAVGLTGAPVQLTVLGRSGDQVHEVIDEQVPMLRDLDADVVFVSVGANDVTALTRRSTFHGRYRRMVQAIRALVPDARVVLIGIPDIGTAPRLAIPLRQLTGLRGRHLDRAIEGIADELGVDHVDLAGRTSDEFGSKPERYFSDDDFHPSSDGHGVWADAVLDVIGRRSVWRESAEG